MGNSICQTLIMALLPLFFLILTSQFSFSSAIYDASVSSSTDAAISKDQTNLETYIILLMKPDGIEFTESEHLESWYQSFLPGNTFNSDQPRLVHSYQHAVTGFSAKLTADEAKALEMKEEVILVRPQMMATLHTTHTPSFLGLQQNLGVWKQSNYGKGVIIGLVDSGITADHPSFSGKGMPPPPARWKGKCELKGKLSCNNKLIGARNFATDSNDMVDRAEHGTHTAGTAAGSPVHGVSYFGKANGTAIGIAPLAHLAMYKVSDIGGQTGESEMLAALDAAIGDNVDVLSLSVGLGSHHFYNSTIAIGAYSATKKGIFVSCSAGNDGPQPKTLENEAPWLLTVGASTVDRAIRATVVLGNKIELNGESFYQPKSFHPKLLPLVYPGANGNASTAACIPGSLKIFNVKGKIVLCEGRDLTVQKGQEVKDNGGAAMIVMNLKFEGFVFQPQNHVLPASHVSYNAGSKIKAYIKSTSSPEATILFKGTVYGLPEAPQVSGFSSRGPSLITPGILKPDIIGPGHRILAAWPYSVDNSRNKFEFISGTSMSCPHLSGIAALLKSSHPDWSTAAIKSAIITTASLSNLGGKRITSDEFVKTSLFDTGAGHVNPSAAHDPGLIYDIQPEDYIPYLCGLGYTNKQIFLIVQLKVECSKKTSIPEAQLNYPSFSINLGSHPQKYTRTVTNVGKPTSIYLVQIVAPEGVDVVVTPQKISFSESNQKATYSVTFTKNVKFSVSGGYAEGYLNWKGEGYNVRSPIAVIFK